MRQLESVVKEVRTGPFGHTGRFEIVVLGEKENKEVNNFSTYGVIKNPYAYLVGAVLRGNRSLVYYGYLFQRILLEATKLGLGTCWLGGTFNRSAVSKVFPLQPEEIIPAVSPIGIPAEKKAWWMESFAGVPLPSIGNPGNNYSLPIKPSSRILNGTTSGEQHWKESGWLLQP